MARLPGLQERKVSMTIFVRAASLRTVDDAGRRDEIPRRDGVDRVVRQVLADIQWIGASKCVPVCSPQVNLFQYQAGPRPS